MKRTRGCAGTTSRHSAMRAFAGKWMNLLILAQVLWNCSDVRAVDVRPVQVWPSGGEYTNGVAVILRCTNGHVRYTVDGTVPEATSPLYQDPIWIVTNTVLNAAAFTQAGRVSEPSRERYTIRAEGTFAESAPLPILVLHTRGQAPKYRERIPVWLGLFGSEHGSNAWAGPIQYEGKGELAIRGNSSSRREKKPYRLEFHDAQGEDLEMPVLGLPREADWILLPCYLDPTFARDILSYELWRRMGHYAPRWRLVELYMIQDERPTMPFVQGFSSALQCPSPGSERLLGAGDYEGVYLLVEKIKRDKNRLDLTKLRKRDGQEPEVSGGYIIKKDRNNPGESGFRSGQGVEFCFEEPKESDITQAQRAWLTGYVARVEQSLFHTPLNDPLHGYRQYLDAASFIDYHWMTELGRNLDGYWFSVYLHKDRGGKLKLGPVWDMDRAFGNGGFAWVDEVAGWPWAGPKDEFYKWYERMFEDPDFLQAYIDRWSELRERILSDAQLEEIVEHVVRALRPALARNLRRWPVSDAPLFQTGDCTSLEEVGIGAYMERIRKLKAWLQARTGWIDSQGFPPPSLKFIRETGGGQLQFELQGEGGAIYFTLDHGDPRASGGGVSHKAVRYDPPQTMTREQVLFARILSPYQLWSAPLLVRGTDIPPGRQTQP